MAKAKEKNVPVIAYDRIINNTDAVSYLASKCVRMIKAVVEGTAPTINDVKASNNGAMIIPAYLCVPQIIDKENVSQYLK